MSALPGTYETDPARIRAALEFVPASNREVWLRVLMAIKAELGEHGSDVAEEWSQTADSYNARDFRDVWKGIKPGGAVGIGTLFYTARENGWRDDETYVRPTAEQLAERQQAAAQAAALVESQRTAKHLAAAKTASKIWDAAKPAKADHDYLKRKSVQPLAMLRELTATELAKIAGYAPQSSGELLAGRVLIAPIELNGQLASLEFIDETGRKSALAGGAKRGGYAPLQPMPTGDGQGLTLLIGEGLATCLSAREATGFATFAALSSGNLASVASQLRAQMPSARIVVLADLVKATGEPDPHAVQAAQTAGAFLAVPDFGQDREPGQTDFNDLAARHGLEKVRLAIEQSSQIKPVFSELARKDANSCELVNSSIKSMTYAAKSSANSCEVVANSLAQREWDTVISPPTADPAMFYGLLGEFAKCAALGTEANPVAVMAGAMAWLSSAMGRNIGLFAGNAWHGIRLNTVHVGRSSVGRKGDSLALLKRTIKAMATERTELLPKKHEGGLSTREGLAMLIHDDYYAGKEMIEGIIDKRLFVIEEEFCNVLSQSKREGNTLSACVRGLFDGVSIQPAAKSGVWASNPHIAIHGCITPTELRTKMSEGEMGNGFANRFMIFWAERTCINAFPRRASDDEVDGLAEKFRDVIEFGLSGYPIGKDTVTLKLLPGARAAYEQAYREFNTPHPGGERITGLLARRAPILLRMAGLFAITDRTLEISAQHIQAAHAWMAYFAQSVHFIFPPSTNSAEHETLRNEHSEKLNAWLKGKGWQARTAITRECFAGHVNAPAVDAALLSLTLENRIDRREVPLNKTKRTEYRTSSQRVRNEFASEKSLQVIDLQHKLTTSHDFARVRTPISNLPKIEANSPNYVEGEL